jgi:hypothetical protein
MMMRRKILFVIILIAISILTLGTEVGASAKGKDQTNIETAKPVPQAATVVTVQVTPVGSTGNFRHPGVAEDSKGNRLVIFRGASGTSYWYSYCPKNGTWSPAAAINNGVQPALVSSNSSYIVIDSSDRFQCQWENANAMVYASFKDGVWTTPVKISTRGRYDLTSAMAIRSNDELVAIDCEVTGNDKEAYLHRKGKNDAEFGTPFNVSRDGVIASTQPHLAIDSEDHIWAVWKSDFLHDGLDENLVIYLAEFGLNSEDIGDWVMVSPDPAWSFLPQVAVNNEDKVMTMFSCSTSGQYLTRLYDPATKKLSAMGSLEIGLCRIPWHSFFTRLAAHGKDFYAAAFDGGRTLFLMKYIETTNKWEVVATVSDKTVEQISLYSGYDQMIIAWNSYEDPTAVFVTTVGVDPYSRIRIKSVSNLAVVKRTERNFFHSFTLNALTWTANPENTEKGITITAQKIYRKSRTEDDTKWTLITSVAGTVLNYDDRNIAANSDYVYAVTCVDDNQHESKIF